MKYHNLLPYLRKLARNLDETVGEKAREEILDGCESITAKSSKVLRAQIMKEVMIRMESQMDMETAVAVREKCACKPNNQLKPIRELYQKSPDMKTFIKELNAMGNQGRYILHNNIILGSYNHGKCICSMVKATQEKIPMLWCECCKGHVKWLFENTFDFPVHVEMLETITFGNDDCRFKVILPENLKS